MTVAYHAWRFRRLLDELADADPAVEARRCIDLWRELAQAAEQAAEAAQYEHDPQMKRIAAQTMRQAMQISAAGVAALTVEKAKRR
jgi:hypothetical protein